VNIVAGGILDITPASLKWRHCNLQKPTTVIAFLLGLIAIEPNFFKIFVTCIEIKFYIALVQTQVSDFKACKRQDLRL